jgi:hypothetical protein
VADRRRIRDIDRRHVITSYSVRAPWAHDTIPISSITGCTDHFIAEHTLSVLVSELIAKLACPREALGLLKEFRGHFFQLTFVLRPVAFLWLFHSRACWLYNSYWIKPIETLLCAS